MTADDLAALRKWALSHREKSRAFDRVLDLIDEFETVSLAHRITSDRLARSEKVPVAALAPPPVPSPPKAAAPAVETNDLKFR